MHDEAGVVLRSGTDATAGVAWATKLLHVELGTRGEVGTEIGRAGQEDRVSRTRKTLAGEFVAQALHRLAEEFGPLAAAAKNVA